MVGALGTRLAAPPLGGPRSKGLTPLLGPLSSIPSFATRGLILRLPLGASPSPSARHGAARPGEYRRSRLSELQPEPANARLLSRLSLGPTRLAFRTPVCVVLPSIEERKKRRKEEPSAHGPKSVDNVVLGSLTDYPWIDVGEESLE
ncbi:hypothetical protein KM043_016715 [Ampulex compressa]|nr:hypothetical protein KM043_016715 [Ampulex compressa]